MVFSKPTLTAQPQRGDLELAHSFALCGSTVLRLMLRTLAATSGDQLMPQCLRYRMQSIFSAQLCLRLF